MNKDRRKELQKVSERIADAIAELEAAKSDLESLRDQEQEYYDNMPASLQDSEKAYAADEAIQNMEDAISALDDIDGDSIVNSIQEAQN